MAIAATMRGSRTANVVAMITGNGLKDIQGALKAVGRPHDIPPDLSAVEQIVGAS